MNNIGYDVEGFLLDGSDYIPAERVLDGTKGRGMSIGTDVLAHPDNVMAEFSSANPFSSETLYDRVQQDAEAMMNYLRPVQLSMVSSIIMPEDMLRTSKLAGEIGCSPDFSYDSMRDPLKAEELGLERYAGGHIHFDLHQHLPPAWAASVADIMLGVPLIAMGEQQGGRRKTYGLPGLNRPKSYGFEYRTLSNYWVSLIMSGAENGRQFCHLVDRVSRAFSDLDHSILGLVPIHGDWAKEIITNEDRDEATNLWQVIQGVV